MILDNYVQNNKLSVYVIPNAKKNELFYDNERNILVARVNAVALNNEANKELIHFIRREYGLKCTIVKGITSRNKVIELI